MAPSPITLWQIDGETMEAVTDLIFLGSKITADGDCSHEIKRRLLLGRKVMTNLDRILKSKDITLSTKVRLVKPMVFPVVMYGCESWTIKKAEHQRMDAFALWCWRRLLRNSESFASSFPIWIIFISFSALIAAAKTSKTMLNSKVRVGTLVLFLTLGEMLSIFHH